MSMLVDVVIRLWTSNHHTGLGVTPLIRHLCSSSLGSTEVWARPRFSGSPCQKEFGRRAVRSPIVIQFVSHKKGTVMKAACKPISSTHYVRRALIVFTLLTVTAFQPAAGQSLVIRDLGTLPGGNSSQAVGINERGQVVGYSIDARGDQHASLFENGVVTDLHTLPGGDTLSAAYAINNRHPAGSYSFNSSGYPRATLFEKGRWIDLGTLPGGDNSAASAIDHRRQVIAWSFAPSRAPQAFLFLKAGMTNLGTLPRGYFSAASPINKRGPVGGWSTAAH